MTHRNITLIRWIVTPAIAFLGMLGITHTLNKVDALHEEAANNELLYFPNEKLLNHFTAGMSNIVSDLMWLKTIQYTSSEFSEQNRKFTWLEHMCNTVTELDPYFKDAYVNGGTFMASIGADEKALKLLKKGLVTNPDSYEIPYEIAKVYLLNRRNDPGSPAIVSHYITMAGERHEPEYREQFFSWAKRILEDNDLADDAYAIWQDVLDTSEDPFLRKLAQANLDSMAIHMNVKELNKLAVQFQEKEKRIPQEMSDLLDEQMLAQLTQHEELGIYYLDKGTVKNTVLQEDIKERTIMGLNGAIVEYKIQHNRYPSSLEEFANWLEGPMPEHPHPNQQWTYDPETGTFS